jgi:hypothetical protein
MNINRTNQYNDSVRLQNQIETKKLDRQHDELVIEDLRLQETIKQNELKRLEMARRNNRAPGSTIDVIV